MMIVILLPLKILLTITILLCTSQSSFTLVRTFTPHLPSQNVALVRHYKFLHSTSNGNNFDYEYIPPRTAEDGRRRSSSIVSSSSSSSSMILTSTYPPNTPAGLRGEAIRSAIRSSNHHPIGWNFHNTIYECGIVEVISTTLTGTTSSLLTFLNGKFTQYITLPSSTESLYTETSFLNSKGQIIDKISIAIPNTSTGSSTSSKAYLLTSPGHTSQSLYNQLDPFIFPMDQIKLVPKSKSSFHMFHLLSSKLQVIQDCYSKYILSQLPLSNIQLETYQTLPLPGQCIEIPFVTSTNIDPTSLQQQQQQQMTLLILPSAGLPNCAGYGYTFCFWSQDATTSQQQQDQSSHIGHTIWQYMISEQCADGPIEIGTLEYDTLRIECGQPLYNNELTATVTKKGIPTLPKIPIPITLTTIESNDDDMADMTTNTTPTSTTMGGTTPASPLELGLDYTVDTSKNKGCYQGQEGIASVLKNPRGPPRTLYQVIFDDDSNIYDYQSEGEYTSSSQNRKDGTVNNLTRTPMPNDVLYVLGSNEEIMVGRITSVAEPSGTGEPITIALALIRRADSIQSSMKQMGIDMPSAVTKPLDRNDDNENGSILIPPPPLDALDGLEVIIGGTFTIGTLRMIPSRRSRDTKFLFSDDDIPSFVQNLPSEQDMYDLFPLTKLKDEEDRNTYESMNESRSRASTAQSADIVTDTNVRNQPKIDNWDDDQVDSAFDTTSTSTTEIMSLQDEEKELELAIQEAEEAAKEAQRKAAKLELLRQRAEEAIARRKQKQQQE